MTLTATPDTGLVFVGWAGVCTGTGTCQITVNGPQSVVAHFASPLQYYHLDVLGSVRMITNAAGAVVRRHDYFAFGEDIEGPTGDPRRFTGKERDPETELHYFGARYYRNLWGRFTSVDPVMNLDDAVVDPQRWNRYSYVTNRPTQYVDPDGRNLLKWAYKIGKVVVKGGSLAAEFEGVLADVDTLRSGESSIWAKAGALASLATEVVSPVSIRDGKGIVQMVVKKGDDAKDAVGKLHGHHIFPQRADLAEAFEQRGINIDLFIKKIPVDLHREIHGGGPRGGKWNAAWRAFFDKNPNATDQDIYKYAETLIRDFGLSGGG